MLRWFVHPLLFSLLAASFGAAAAPAAAGYDEHGQAVAAACDVQVEDLRQHDAPPPIPAAPAPAPGWGPPRIPPPDTPEAAISCAAAGYFSRAPPTALQ